MTVMFLKKYLKKMADVHRRRSRKHFKPNPTHMVCPVYGPQGQILYLKVSAFRGLAFMRRINYGLWENLVL